MSDLPATGLVRARQITQDMVLFVLPIAVLGLLIIALFFDFLGAQSSEIAKLINEIEIQCKADLWSSLGSAPALDTAVTGNLACGEYAPKVGLFFLLLALWCVIANVVTLKLFQNVEFRRLRFVIASLVVVSLPAILLIKYLGVIPTATFPVFAAAVALQTLLFVGLFAFRFFRRPDYLIGRAWIMAVFVGSIVIFVGLSLLFAYYPANLFNYIGSTNTLVLYAVLAYAFVGGLFYYGRATGIPFAALLLIWVFALNAWGTNDNHTVQARPVTGQGVKGDQQFLNWLEARRDRAAYTDRDYPVYIVASAGGGIYAAMRTAYFLDVLQQKCPSFAHHIFAISSVSGGGLGALAFAAQRQSLEQQDLTGCVDLEPAGAAAIYRETPILDSFFAKDLIATIVGAGLFPDMLQRVLPFSIDALDRSEAFRKAMGENWRAALRSTAERRPSIMRRTAPGPTDRCSTQRFFSRCEINAYWDPAGDIPMLIFNATEVDSGSPVVLSNLDARYYANSLAARNSPNFENRSIYVIDGASLSARFPIALPAGFLDDVGGSSRVRLVDGGYFDGSGLTIAQAVKLALDGIAAQQNLRVNVRIIYLGEKVPSVYDVMARAAQGGAPATPTVSVPRGAELSAHIKALLQARDQRSAETLRQAFRIDPSLLGFQWDPTFDGVDPTPCSNVPLAWYLAPCTQRVLKERLRNAVLENVDSLDVLRRELSPP